MKVLATTSAQQREHGQQQREHEQQEHEHEPRSVTESLSEADSRGVVQLSHTATTTISSLQVAMGAPAANTTATPLFIGLDCSTQSMSAVVTDAHGAVVHESTFRFDDHLPTYNTTNGVLRMRDAADRETVVIPTLLFVDALDAIFADLAAADAVDLARVTGISGSAQQHASVYWSSRFSLQACMDAADAQTRLVDVLTYDNSSDKATAPFYLEHGPSWMDSSTTTFCRALEAAVGGAQRVADISGSRAYERFTSNQIAKRLHDDPSLLDHVGRIALVSSLLTSLLCGDFTPIDESDGSGMNLLDVRSRSWSRALIDATAAAAHGSSTEDITQTSERLLAALGSTVAKPYRRVGTVHRYFQERYGLPANCAVVPFTGDNPSTLAGIGLATPGDVGVSLGTSSTLIAVVDAAKARLSGDEGHFFTNPIDPDSLMAMICFKNGALTRQDVRDRCANRSWDTFASLLATTPPGNDGVCAFYYSDPEITPATTNAGVVAFDVDDQAIDETTLSPAAQVRAVVESQFLSMRLHAARLGVTQPQRLIAVGGASANAQLVQVLADVFAASVYRLTTADSINSAALGGALRARHGLACEQQQELAANDAFVPFARSESQRIALVAAPNAAAVAVYAAGLKRFEALEARAVAML